MEQPRSETRIGYALKQAAWALRTQMDVGLRPLGISVPQYSCLTALSFNPGISNADLARATFVSRQASHQLLAGLQRLDLIEIRGQGRAQRLTLTAGGAELLDAAAEIVAATEEQMIAHLDTEERERLLADLGRCAANLPP